MMLTDEELDAIEADSRGGVVVPPHKTAALVAEVRSLRTALAALIKAAGHLDDYSGFETGRAEDFEDALRLARRAMNPVSGEVMPGGDVDIAAALGADVVREYDSHSLAVREELLRRGARNPLGRLGSSGYIKVIPSRGGDMSPGGDA